MDISFVQGRKIGGWEIPETKMCIIGGGGG